MFHASVTHGLKNQLIVLNQSDLEVNKNVLGHWRRANRKDKGREKPTPLIVTRLMFILIF